MILSAMKREAPEPAVYQRGWMIDSQLPYGAATNAASISKGMDD